MESNLDSFENLKFNPFSLNDNILVKNLNDPDQNFFNENKMQNLDTPYFDINEVKTKLRDITDSNSFSVNRQPDGKLKPFKNHLKQFFDISTKENKKLFLLGDYNINCLLIMKLIRLCATS